MRAALAGTEWDAVIDVSGFVMAAGGGEFEELLAMLDGSVGAYVFVSSIMAYAPSGLMPWREDAPVTPDPVTTYGGFKAHAERAILDRHARTGFPGSVARPAAIYGPDNNIHDMETAMFLRLRRGLPILLPHEGLVTTSYGHVDDLCRNLLEMAQLPAAAGEIVNTTGGGASARAWTELLAGIVGVEADIVERAHGLHRCQAGLRPSLRRQAPRHPLRREGRRPRPDGRARHPSRVRGDLRVVLREPPRRRPGHAVRPALGGWLRLRPRGGGRRGAAVALMEDRVPEAVIRQAIRDGLADPALGSPAQWAAVEAYVDGRGADPWPARRDLLAAGDVPVSDLLPGSPPTWPPRPR